MTDREKMIELIEECAIPITANSGSLMAHYSVYGDEAKHLADHLIAEGVGFLPKWIPASEPPKNDTGTQWILYKVGGSYFYSTGYYDGKCWRSTTTLRRIQIAGWMPPVPPPKGE